MSMLTRLRESSLMDRVGYKTLEEFKEALVKKGNSALDDLYLAHKEEFINFCRSYPIERDDIIDIYQDAIIAFYENVASGKLSSLKSTVKTYIFSIGKYSIFNKLKKEKKTTAFQDEHLKMLDLSIFNDSQVSDSRTVIVREALEQLGERCKRVLVLFYYHSYSIEALMNEMGYKNENVVRSHKSRCLKQLKDMIIAEHKN